MANADVTDPRIQPGTGNTAVKIGLGRPGKTWDCDYAYANETPWQPGQPFSPPLMVPFTGTWNAQQALDVNAQGVFNRPPQFDSKIFAITGHVYSPMTGVPDPTKVTGDETSNIVTWRWVFNGNDTPASTTSLVYSPLAESLSEGGPPTVNNGFIPVLSAFYFQFVIPVFGDPDTVTMTVCSHDWPDEPSLNCTPIENLEFWWHCLASGTMVTLDDGTTCAIEAVENNCRVRSGLGQGSLGVEATSRGVRHRVNPEDPATAIYRLHSVQGRTLVLTAGHPVVTEDGLIRASDLRPGMVLHAVDGSDEVATIEVIGSDALFCNLKLIDASDRKNGLGSTVGTFFANGLLVGDHASMDQLHYNNTHSLDYMKARLPERYHQDYASTLAAIARDNARYGGKY